MRILAMTVLVLLSLAVTPPIVAQPADESAESGELRRAMRDYFQQRLRSELGLTDEQTNEILPKVERIERERTALRRERAETTRALRVGLRQGATDGELQALLDKLGSVQKREQDLRESGQAEIDRLLTVRQRVEYRFFAEAFRRQIQNRIQQLRRDRPDRIRPGARGRQRNRP